MRILSLLAIPTHVIKYNLFHSNDQSAEQFCDVLEAIFLHGLKNFKVLCTVEPLNNASFGASCYQYNFTVMLVVLFER